MHAYGHEKGGRWPNKEYEAIGEVSQGFFVVFTVLLLNEKGKIHQLLCAFLLYSLCVMYLNVLMNVS